MSDDGIKVTTDFGDAFKKKAWLEEYVKRSVTRIVNLTTLNLQKHIRVDLFGTYPSGTTINTLSTRSGKLKKSVTVIPARIENDVVKGGIGIGTVYGSVQFGKRGHVTTITPKSAGALAIPLPAAMNAQGVAKGGPRDPVFGDTFLLPSSSTKSGNAIICGKLTVLKGEKGGQTKGNIVPLFVLKKSVRVPVRIAIEDLQDYIRPLLGKAMSDFRDGLMGSTAMGD